MECYTETTSFWMKARALGFLVNFLKNHKKEIETITTFSLLAGICSKAEFFWTVRKKFSFRKRRVIKRLYKKFEDEDIFFGDSPRFFLRNLWKLETMRSSVAKIVEEIVNRYLEDLSEEEKAPDEKWNELFFKLSTAY